MKVMNILVISLVVVVSSLFLFNEKASAQQGMVLGDVAIMRNYNQKTHNLEIIVYHKPSNSFLIYGYISREHKGLQLLDVRRLEHDFLFAEKRKDKTLDYNKAGYSTNEMKFFTSKIKKEK